MSIRICAYDFFMILGVEIAVTFFSRTVFKFVQILEKWIKW